MCSNLSFALVQVMGISLVAVRMITCMGCQCPSLWFISLVEWCCSWLMVLWWVRGGADDIMMYISYVMFINECICFRAQRAEHTSSPASFFQGAYAGFVYTYAVQPPMLLPHKTAGYLASVFWAAITAGRLLSIPLSYRFKPVRLLLFNLVKPIKHWSALTLSNTQWNLSQTLIEFLIVFSLLYSYRQAPLLPCWCYLFSTPAVPFSLQAPVYVGCSSAAFSPVCLPSPKTSSITRVQWDSYRTITITQ